MSVQGLSLHIRAGLALMAVAEVMQVAVIIVERFPRP